MVPSPLAGRATPYTNLPFRNHEINPVVVSQFECRAASSPAMAGGGGLGRSRKAGQAGGSPDPTSHIRALPLP
jgi:hypothetical protein